MGVLLESSSPYELQILTFIVKIVSARRRLKWVDFAPYFPTMHQLMCFIPIAANPYINLQRHCQLRCVDHVCP
jgi:hypothetical protein